MEIRDVQNSWRSLLTMQASFRTVIFHVETGARLSGRRTVLHEYPKKNLPYAEDMGRHAKRFHFSGYLIYRPNGSYDYVSQRLKLVRALEEDGPGQLVHPVFTNPEGGPFWVMVERYTMVENRQRGGFTEFEMQFVEVGAPGNSVGSVNFSAVVNSNNNASEQAAAANVNVITQGNYNAPYMGGKPA